MEGFVDNDLVYKWGNVLYLRYTSAAPTAANLDAAANKVYGNWATDMAPECPSPTTLTSVTITDLTSDSAAEGSFTGSTAGTRGDDSIPANAAVLVSYPTSTRYKGGHPRNYLYVLGNADLEGAAHWSAAATAEVQAHWRSFLTNLRADISTVFTCDSWGSVRYHGKYLPNGGPPHYYLDTPIFMPFGDNVATTHAEMASQRRRVGRRKA